MNPSYYLNEGPSNTAPTPLLTAQISELFILEDLIHNNLNSIDTSIDRLSIRTRQGSTGEDIPENQAPTITDRLNKLIRFMTYLKDKTEEQASILKDLVG